MSDKGNKLEVRIISEIEGVFRIPSYQRGYRWEKRQVEQLLDDLVLHYDTRKDPEVPYYLQPIVVAPFQHEDKNSIYVDPSLRLDEESYDFDLIDGQQRLTTIFLILKALKEAQGYDLKQVQSMNLSDEEVEKLITLKRSLGKITPELKFEIIYQTRKKTKDFLNSVETKEASDKEVTLSPDHLYIWHAYQIIKKWIIDNTDNVKKMADVLLNGVRLIWYELSESVPNWKKFTDLNVGKISLTNSELIKALVLRRNDKEELPDYEQDVIVNQWDEIERELSEEKLWRFLTKKPMRNYPTKIDLLFDLIAGKEEKHKKDEFFTFRFFNEIFDKNRAKKKSKKSDWEYIHAIYRRIHDWYKDDWMYHRIGYLLAVGDENTLRDLYLTTYPVDKKTGEEMTPLSHQQLRDEINRRIRVSLTMPEIQSLEELKYNENNEVIERLLTLYNVMIADELSDKGVRYPFHLHNDRENGGWSLEHIHAQNSDELRGDTEWKTWVSEQLESLKRLYPQMQSQVENFNNERYQKLVEEMENFISGSSNYENFKKIVTEFADLTSVKDGEESHYDMHSLANLALLSRNDNSMLNKSTFDVKRMKIAAKSSSNFVPIGTERVFMKAFAGFSKNQDGNELPETRYSCDTSQMFFWGDKDRHAYLRDIEEKLKDYLPEFKIKKEEKDGNW